MNFKPTLWKTIVSILSGLITFLVLSIYWTKYLFSLCPVGVECNRLVSNYSYVLPSLIVIIIVYVIWSLFEKNKTSKRR